MDQTSTKRLILFSIIGIVFIVMLMVTVWLVNQGRTPLYVRDMTKEPVIPISSVDISEPNVLGSFDLSVLGDLEEPVIAFVRSADRELWLYSRDGELLGLGIERVARVFNGPNTRWIVYQGFGDVTRGGSNAIYAFNLHEGATKKVVHEDVSENELAVIGADVAISPNEQYLVYRVSFVTIKGGFPSGIADPYPQGKNGIYVYDLVNDTTRYLGNAQGQFMWASDSKRVLLTEGVEYHAYDLSRGDYFVNVLTMDRELANDSKEAELLIDHKNSRSKTDDALVSSLLKWIDDDTYIAVGIKSGSPLGGDLYEIDIETGDMRQLTRLGDVVLF